MTNYLIFGASRGLGAALATAVPQPDDQLWLVSRSRPAVLDLNNGIQRHWITADLTDPAAPKQIATVIGEETIDILLYNTGIWESTAFSSQYDFEAIDPLENHRVLTVNLTAVIDCIQALIPAVRRSDNGKIIMIGSTSGLDNASGPEVAYVASKFGVRGVAHALRGILRPDQIGVTCINPGDIATEYPLDSGASLEDAGKIGIPLSDLVSVVRCVVSLSKYSCVKEIDMPAMRDMGA